MIPEHRLGVYPSQKAKCESRFQLEQVTASRQPKAESGEPRAKSGTQKTLSPLDHVFLYLSLLEDVFCKQFPANAMIPEYRWYRVYNPEERGRKLKS